MNMHTLACTLFAFIAAVLSRSVSNLPEAEANPASYLSSEAEMAHWLSTTDAELVYLGTPPNPFSPRGAQGTTIVYCTNRSGAVCGGVCTVYSGGAACIDAPRTKCLKATQDVGFCDKRGCDGNCAALSACGTWLKNGFCFTPGTRSIVVSPL
ncbi:hypothetical protein BD413DRAFT_611801 [Trametes elegans]|nr:hypothetical protein BD413DRAFT_611801 [Trametes elegans]